MTKRISKDLVVNGATLVTKDAWSGELDAKHEKLVEWLRAQKLAGVLIKRNENVAWVTGGAVELRVLIDLTGKDRCGTLAGDTAQRMLDDDADAVEFDWHALLKDLDVPHTTLEPLKVSYRSTAQITDFARKVLGPLAHEAEPLATRQCPPIELFTFGSPGADTYIRNS